MPEGAEIAKRRVDLLRKGRTIVDLPNKEARGLFLLFAKGERPDIPEIAEFAEANRDVTLVWHSDGLDDSGENSAAKSSDRPGFEQKNATKLEMLRDGLTFDLSGFGKTGSTRFPPVLHRFDLDTAVDPSADPTAFEAFQLVPGHHLSGADNSMPVARTLIGLARDLVREFKEIEAVIWPPSASAIGRRFFESVATAWLEGGVFPALGLTAFAEEEDGSIKSIGLDYWVGQELLIGPPISNDKVAATRLGVRLVNQIVIVDGLNRDERIVAPDGSKLVLNVSEDGKIIRVVRE